MNRFFYTLESVPSDLAIKAFGREHLTWLIVFVLLGAGCVALYRRLDDRRRDHMRLILAALAVAVGLFKQICLIKGGMWHPAYLPFCFCSLGIFFMALHALRGNAFFADVLYVFYLPMSFFALLDPYWLALPGKNFLSWYYFAAHILLLIYPLMLVVGRTLRPDPRHIPRLVLLAVCLWIPLFALDAALDVNFLFLMSPPAGNILNWFTAKCGAHLVGVPVLTALMLLGMYGIAVLFGFSAKKGE